MSSPARPSHPWHPALVHFPIACWCLALLVDLLAWSSLVPDAAGVEPGGPSHLLLWIGTATAVPAIAAGVVDYLRLPPSVQDSVALNRHMLWMGGAWTIFLVAGIWRIQAAPFGSIPRGSAVLMEVAGALCLVFGGRSAARVVFQELALARAQDIAKSNNR